MKSCEALHAGMYLHVFPLCSVNSLHLHVVNLARRGQGRTLVHLFGSRYALSVRQGVV